MSNLNPKAIGPNVKKLIAHKMALDAIPPGGGFASGIDFILSGRLAQSWKDAANWVRAAIEVVRISPDNPFGDNDEAIAEELLKRIKERQR